MFQATIIVGSGATVWSVTNAGGDCTASPAVGTVCADGTIYAGLSPDTSTKMFVTRCDYGQSWNGSSCAGSALSKNWNNGTSSSFMTGYNNSNTGKANSAGLAALTGLGAPYAAAVACEALTQDGYSDWYLPSRNELLVVAQNRATIRNFFSAGYWTSTENAGVYDNAFYVDFTDGSSYYIGSVKNFTMRVRCVRR
jgi:hypothetical protein